MTAFSSQARFFWEQEIEFEIDVNRDAWSWAEIVDNSAREIALVRREGYSNDRLLCADFRPLLKLAGPNQVVSSQWHGDTLAISLDPASVERTLFVSQAYWPGWMATAEGRDTKVFPLAGAFTGIAVPTGASDVRLS